MIAKKNLNIIFIKPILMIAGILTHIINNNIRKIIQFQDINQEIFI